MEPITRQEKLMDGQYVEPITRTEKILAGEDIDPVTRYEYFLKKYRGGGGGDIDVVQLSVTENGDYTAPEGKAYSPVHVAVPESVLTTKSITANGTYNASSDNADGYSSVAVDVPLPENAYLLKTYEDVPASIATFSDGSNLPVKELVVNIDPIQSGSGDPSPSNIRAISGRTETNIMDCGVNLWDEEWEAGGLMWLTGEEDNSSSALTSRIRSKYFNCKANTTYYLYATYTTGFCFYDKNKNFISTITGYSNRTFTTPINCYYMRFSPNTGSATYNNDISINYPSTDTSYHAYNGHTYTIQLGDTYYGCTINVTTGLMVVKRLYVDMGTMSWTYEDSETPKRFRASAPSLPKSNTTPMCSNYKGYLGSITNIPDKAVAISGAGQYIFIRVRDDSYTDKTTFETAMNGVQLVYELATPIEVQLTPTQVNTILGENVLFADSGDVVKLDYLAKEV